MRPSRPGSRRKADIAALPRLLADRVHVPHAMAAKLVGRAKGQLSPIGTTVDHSGALIAGIALRHEATLAARDDRHFAPIEGLKALDPWYLRPGPTS